MMCGVRESIRGALPLIPPPPFLPLMEEKEAKEDQGVRDAGQLGATSDFSDLSDKEDGACAPLADGEDEGAIDAEEDGLFLVNGHG